MVVGVCQIEIFFHDTHSLKEKRGLVKSILGKTRSRFNVAAAEVGSLDLWQRAELAVTVGGTDRAFVNSVLDKALNFIEGLHIGEIIDHRVELISI